MQLQASRGVRHVDLQPSKGLVYNFWQLPSNTRSSCSHGNVSSSFFLTAFPAFNKLPIITIILSPESHSSPAVIAPPGSQRRDAQAVYSRFSLRQWTNKDLPVQTKSCFPLAPNWLLPVYWHCIPVGWAQSCGARHNEQGGTEITYARISISNVAGDANASVFWSVTGNTGEGLIFTKSRKSESYVFNQNSFWKINLPNLLV